MDALTAIGVDYNQFTRMPGSLNPDALESMQKRKFGKTFSSSQRERLALATAARERAQAKGLTAAQWLIERLKQPTALAADLFMVFDVGGEVVAR